MSSKLNPIEKSKYINQRYKEYLRSSFEVGNKGMQKLFEEQLEKENLFKGPYVDLNLPFQRGMSLRQLIDDGVVSSLFSKLNDVFLERPLYLHQEKAIRQIGRGRGAIVTTGTGSGKSECFLFPILNELLQDIEKGNKDVGVRAIFLYPMNALVNDQIERVRKILKDCPEISYGFFTGETPEHVTKDYREKYGAENNNYIPLHELVSREEIRENPPHLLFTNYSMLEYLLIRPNDYAIFEPSKLNHWKFVVLDEAHTYYGSVGIEISLLMRRLTGMASKQPRFILTSATLGVQGKSEKEIIDFANSLTSSHFVVDDIIFSERIPFQLDESNRFIPKDEYRTLKDNLENKNEVIKIVEKYIEPKAETVQELLFDLLSKDRNVYDLYKVLLTGSVPFDLIYEKFQERMSAEDLIALIDLVNVAQKNGVGLFDLKYHSFVRPLSGAYITLSDEQKLSLTKTNTIDDLKAFEIGNCRYCNSPYIIGRVVLNESDGLEYLYQNNEIDIYENYGDNEYVKLDYFLLENALNEEEVDKDVLEEDIICAKCGCISSAKNLNAVRCQCGTEYQKIIYKVDQANANFSDKGTYNNINQCPCCGHRAQSGIVRVLNLGKDEGTALIAQILYEAIDEGEGAIQPKKLNLSLKPSSENVEKKREEKIKQFLVFSDSRQQASFSAVFFDSNHTRMLRKRLIWKVLEDKSFQNVKIDELAAYLTDYIKKKNLFTGSLSAHKNAWITLLVDLLKIDGAYDGEGLGLYYFDLDISDIMNELDEEEVKEEFGRHNISKSDLETVIKVVFNIFKITPAIHYIKSTLTPDEKKEWLEFRQFDNYICFKKPPKSKSNGEIRSFLPVNAAENMVVRYIEKSFKCERSRAEEILDIIFNRLAVEISQVQDNEKLFIKHSSKEAYQIDVSRYVVKNYINNQYYQCTKCGRLTPYNVHDVCPRDKCDGKLKKVNPDEALATNFYRNQYKTKKIERIVIEEHTAQLDRKKAKEYQDNFKNKKINILSCSTTFEMGVDIGSLETVFLRNVPPTPANYVQRAGRAGRRKESSAYILTYCGMGSHDYTYFTQPEKMISGIIRPPYFNVLNKKIIIRHLMAACLGFFFRKHPDYYNNFEEMVFKDGQEVFNQYIKNCPEDLNNYINTKVLYGSAYQGYHNFKWFEEMGGKDEKLEHLVEYYQELENEYQEAKELSLEEERGADADYYKNQIKSLHNKKLIDMLSKFCVIPKYGFPVDVVNLEVYESGKLNNGYDLSRDLKVALSEYAPNSEIIVDKNKYTSEYIGLSKTSPFPKNYFCTCENCKKINIFASSGEGKTCKYCGEPIGKSILEYFIEPVYGFKTGVNKESTRMKPKRSYSGEISYLGGGSKENKINIGNVIAVETSSNDELLIMNRSNFYMCATCGYSQIDKSSNVVPMIEREHRNYKQYACKDKEMELLKIGHRFKTDVTRFTIPLLDSSGKHAAGKALSFMYAFLEGISNSLGIERNDIDGVLELNLENKSYDILVFDSVPGGAGHVKRLLDRDSIIQCLEQALIKVSQECCDENTSCYNCLRNYYNQSNHNRLKRIYAKEYIESILQMEKKDMIKAREESEKKRYDIGNRKSHYVAQEYSNAKGPSNSFEGLLDQVTDDEIKKVIRSMIKYSKMGNMEQPVLDERIDLDVTIWPDLIWPKSKVALFLQENKRGYERLKTYDWYCYILNKDLLPEDVFEFVVKEE